MNGVRAFGCVLAMRHLTGARCTSPEQGLLELKHADTNLVIERVPASSPNMTVIFDRVIASLREPYAFLSLPSSSEPSRHIFLGGSALFLRRCSFGRFTVSLLDLVATEDGSGLLPPVRAVARSVQMNRPLCCFARACRCASISR